MPKYDFALSNDANEKMIDSEDLNINNDIFYKCPECKKAVLVHINGFQRKDIYIGPYFRTKKGMNHAITCSLSHNSLFPTNSNGVPIIVFPIISRHSAESILSYDNYVYQKNIRRLLALKEIIMDDSIQYVKIQQQIINKSEFVKRFFINYINFDNCLIRTGHMFLVGEVIHKDLKKKTSTLHLSQLYRYPRIKIGYKDNLNNGDLVMIYLNKESEYIDTEPNHPNYYLFNQETTVAIVVDSLFKNKIYSILDTLIWDFNVKKI